MPRKINEKKYGISKHRYKELSGFCEQYREWKLWLEQYQDTVSGQCIDGMPHGSGGHSEPTANLAIKRQQLEANCKMIEDAAKETDAYYAAFILKEVTNAEITYRHLKVVSGMPCEEKKYYELRRKFFQLLNKKKQNF